MVEIISPLQDDGLLLTPEQKQARQKQKVESFMEGLKKLEQETGMCLQVSLQYTPQGIFPGGRIVPLGTRPTKAVESQPAPEKKDEPKTEETKTEEA